MATVLPKTPTRTPSATIANLRWYICGLLFFATTVNYIDRQVLGLLKPVLEKEMGWTEASYGWIVFAFQLAYALMMPLAGRLIDYLGTRLGYLIAVILWSIAAAAHALAGSALGFGAARFALGFSESANFPAAIKTVATWFPQRERALATGIFNSGSNIGALLAPLAVPYLAVHYGWRSAFIATGAMGILWIVAWLWLYREPGEHPLLSAKEYDLIRSGDDAQPRQRIPYRRLLTDRAAWAFLVGKFLTDPVWWFYLFWLPGFLNQTYGVDLSNLGLAACSDLHGVHGGLDRRRLDLFRDDQARLDRQSRPENRHADLRRGGDLGDLCRADRRKPVAGGDAGQYCRGCPSRLVREYLQPALGCVPAERGRLGRRPGRHGRGNRRSVGFSGDRILAGLVEWTPMARCLWSRELST